MDPDRVLELPGSTLDLLSTAIAAWYQHIADEVKHMVSQQPKEGKAEAMKLAYLGIIARGMALWG